MSGWATPILIVYGFALVVLIALSAAQGSRIDRLEKTRVIAEGANMTCKHVTQKIYYCRALDERDSR